MHITHFVMGDKLSFFDVCRATAFIERLARIFFFFFIVSITRKYFKKRYKLGIPIRFRLGPLLD